jgi:hypothetical protein
VKVGENASKTLAIQILANGEYDMKKSRVFLMSWAVERRARKLYKVTQELGIQKHKG